VTHHRSVLAVALLTATLGLTACSGSGSPTSTSEKTTGAGGSTSDTSASTPTSSTASSAASTGGSTKATGMCSFIDQKAAERILGFSTKAGLSAAKMAASGIKKLDGCIYQSMTGGTLGYDVLQVDGQLGRMMLGSAKARMKAASKTSTTLTVFDAGIPDSVSYTMHVGTGVDSQVAVVSGDKFITVAVARKDGNVAKSQTSVKAAAKQLVSAA
jgi:hypothetical protein